jgi:hypothetical protein
VSRGSDEAAENIERFLREQDNLRARHASDVYADPRLQSMVFARSIDPEPIPLAQLPRRVS